MTERLRAEMPILAKSPVNTEIELRHIEVSRADVDITLVINLC